MQISPDFSPVHHIFLCVSSHMQFSVLQGYLVSTNSIQSSPHSSQSSPRSSPLTTHSNHLHTHPNHLHDHLHTPHTPIISTHHTLQSSPHTAHSNHLHTHHNHLHTTSPAIKIDTLDKMSSCNRWHRKDPANSGKTLVLCESSLKLNPRPFSYHHDSEMCEMVAGAGCGHLSVWVCHLLGQVASYATPSSQSIWKTQKRVRCGRIVDMVGKSGEGVWELREEDSPAKRNDR